MIPVLRDYQLHDLERLRTSFRDGSKAVLYQAPTGSGKTVLFAEIIRSALAKGNSAWIIVHRQELVDQTSRALAALSVPHGIVAGGRMISADFPVLVCSIQSLVRRLHRLLPPSLLVVDEAHHAAAATWNKVLAACDKARILGVTATPERLDGKGLGRYFGGHFDSLIVGPSVKILTEQGWLAPAKVYVPPQVANLDGLKIRGGDYAVGATAERMDRAIVTGDAIEHYERLCPGESAIVFCTRISHAANVAAAFRERNWKSESIDGTLHDEVRRARIKALGNGGLHVLTSCEIVSEGTDIPIVSVGILLRPTKSLGMYLQQVGRVLRPAPGKAHALILDHVGNCIEHGLPDDPHDWSLEGRTVKEREKGTVALRICQSCFGAFRPAARVCPYCGVEYGWPEEPIEFNQEKLVEVDQAMRAQIRAQKKSEIGRARTEEDLLQIAKERGYNPGWVRYIMAARAKKGYHGSIDRYDKISTWKGDDARS